MRALRLSASFQAGRGWADVFLPAAWLLTAAFLSGAAASFGAEVAFKLADAKGQPVGDAVVSLVPLDARVAAAADETAPPIEIEQRNEQFSPFVTAIRTGTTVRFPNRDAVAHHVYSLSPAQRFEFPLYKPNTAEALRFDKPGVVTLGCNIHDWMVAHIYVVDTPWFAVAPPDGAVVLRDIPEGNYRAQVWHPRLDKPTVRDIALPAKAPIELTLALKPERRIRRGPDGAKGGYR